MYIILNIVLYFYILLFSLVTNATDCTSEPPPEYKSKIVQLKHNSIYNYLTSLISINPPTSSDSNALCNNSDLTMKIYLKNGGETWRDLSISIGDHISVDVMQSKNGDYYLSTKDLSNTSNRIIDNVLLFPKTYPNDGLLCLSYPTVDGSVPIVCHSYLEKGNSNVTKELNDAHNNNPCFGSNHNSNFVLSFSGRALHCIYHTLDTTFFSNNASDSNLANFAEFQRSIQMVVFAALTLYVILFGITLVLEPKKANKASLSGFVIKFLLVLYFAIGLNVFAWDGTKKVENGFVQYGLPFFKSASYSLASMVFHGAGAKSTLCNFNDFQNIKYKPGMDFYRIWDSIDCRLFTYLGVTPAVLPDTKPALDLPSSLAKFNNTNVAGVLGMFIVLAGILVSGNILFAIYISVFLVLFLSLMIFFISTFIVYTVTIYCMAYFAPIFIPMALFEKTKGYFDGWIKLLISCSVQPAILLGFITLLLITYDGLIYGNQCEFKPHTSTTATHNIIDRFDFINQSACSDSLGYKLTQYISGNGGWKQVASLFVLLYSLVDNMNASYDMLKVMIFSCIAYFFSQIITTFAANITGGPDVGNVAIGPTQLFDTIKKKLKK